MHFIFLPEWETLGWKLNLNFSCSKGKLVWNGPKCCFNIFIGNRNALILASGFFWSWLLIGASRSIDYRKGWESPTIQSRLWMRFPLQLWARRTCCLWRDTFFDVTHYCMSPKGWQDWSKLDVGKKLGPIFGGALRAITTGFVPLVFIHCSPAYS